MDIISDEAESPEDIFILLNKDEYCVQFVEETEFVVSGFQIDRLVSYKCS